MKVSLKLIVVAFLMILGTAFANAQTKVYSFKSYHIYTCEADRFAKEGTVSLPAKLTINEKAKRIVLYLKDTNGKWISVTSYFVKKEPYRRGANYECDGKLFGVGVLQQRDGYSADVSGDLLSDTGFPLNVWMEYGKLTVQK